MRTPIQTTGVASDDSHTGYEQSSLVLCGIILNFDHIREAFLAEAFIPV